MVADRLPKKLETLQNRIQILCTRPLESSQLLLAKTKAIDIDCVSFIETHPIKTKELTKEIKELLTKESTVVFTSMNAVEAVAVYLQKDKPDWNVYCIGITTNKLVKKYFGEKTIIGTATNAAELAGLIVKERNANKLSFFCGDQRRDELPNILRNRGIRVNEVIVYQTESVLHTIDKTYDGILFFSPSAVISFFQTNSILESTRLFAIGYTTAKELKKFTNNETIVSDIPGKENLVKKMIDFFENKQTADF